MHSSYMHKHSSNTSILLTYSVIHQNLDTSEWDTWFLVNIRAMNIKQELCSATYVSELRKLSEYCEYGETLEDMLCDRLVCGLAERRVQQRLLAEGDLTFDKALKIAQAMELAERDARDLQQAGAHSRAGVHRLAQTPVASSQDKSTKPCYRCGGRHDPSQCRFRDAVCHACGKKGHIKRACRSQNKVPSATVGEQTWRQPVHLTEEGTVAALQEYTLYPLQDPATRPLKATVQVDRGPGSHHGGGHWCLSYRHQ